MATLRTINKQVGTPLEVAAVIRRLATPAIIQPTYTFDVSDLGWYAFDGVDGYERILNNQYFNLFGVTGSHLVVDTPTKTGNIVYQGIHPETGYSIPSDASQAYWQTGGAWALLGPYLKEASIGAGLSWNNGTHKLDVSIAFPVTYGWNLTVPGVGYQVETGDTVNFIDSSTIKASGTKVGDQINIVHNVSDYISKTAVDLKNTQQDASISALFVENDNQDVSIAWLASVATHLNTLLDVSVLPELTNGNYIEWEASTSVWQAKESINIDDIFYTKEQIDASFYTKTEVYTKSQVDSSITSLTLKNITQDASIVALQNTKWSTSVPLVREASLGAAFTWTGGLLGVATTQYALNSTTAHATSGTGETVLLATPIGGAPGGGGISGYMQSPASYHIKLGGVSSSTGTVTFIVRVGTAGNTTDASVWISTTSAAQSANTHATLDMMLTFRSNTTVWGDGFATAGSELLPTLAGSVYNRTIPNITSNLIYITISCICSEGTFTSQLISLTESKNSV